MQPVRPPEPGSDCRREFQATGRAPGEGYRGAALASCPLFPHLHFQRGDSGSSEDTEQRWKEGRKPTGLLSPQ